MKLRKSLVLATMLVSSVVSAAKADDEQENSRSQIYRDATRAAEERVARAQLDEFVADAEYAGQSLTELRATVVTFDARLKELEGNDDGKKIASDDTAFLYFIAITDDLARPTAEDIDMKLKTIDGHIALLKEKRTATAAGFSPPPEMKLTVLGTKEWARSQRASVGAKNNWLDSVIASKKDADVSAVPTLKERVGRYEREKIEALMRSRIDGSEEGLKRAQETVRDAARDAEDARGALIADDLKKKVEFDTLTLQAAQKLREAQLREDLAKAEAERLKAVASERAVAFQGQLEAAKITNMQRAKDPAIRMLLAPFITPGRWQPNDGHTIDNAREPTPMSFSEISQSGAFREGRDGLFELHRIGNTNHGSGAVIKRSKNDRPVWAMPAKAKSLSAADFDMLKKAQSLLMELGPTLVELGDLAP